MLKNVLRAVRSLAFAAVLAAAPALAQTYKDSGGTTVPGFVPLAGCTAGGNCAGPLSASNPLPVTGTFSASLGGFTPTSVGTPIAATISGATGTLPSGAVVVATNVGTANGAYCAIGSTSSTAQQYIGPNGGWFAFTIPTGATQMTCVTSTSTTTINLLGGSGLATGAVGGAGGGGGGSSAITTWAGGTLGAMANYGTSPGAVLVPGVNASITNAPTVNLGTLNGAATAANQVVGSNYGNQSNWVSGSGNVSTATQTQIIAAPSSSKLYITNAQCFRTDAGTSMASVTFNDTAGTVEALPAGGGSNVTFTTPLVVPATTAFKFTPSAALSTVYCSAQGYNAP
jgi:hypothetical protein